MTKSSRQLVPPFDPELIGDGEYITLAQFLRELFRRRGSKAPVVRKNSTQRP